MAELALYCVAVQVAECYIPLKEVVEDDVMKGYLPECWISYIKVHAESMIVLVCDVCDMCDVCVWCV